LRRLAESALSFQSLFVEYRRIPCDQEPGITTDEQGIRGNSKRAPSLGITDEVLVEVLPGDHPPIEKIRVALYMLARIEDESIAECEIFGVAIADILVVLAKLEALHHAVDAADDECCAEQP
jgi:hypothetical protein